MVYQGDSMDKVIHPNTSVDRRVLARSFLNLLAGLCILSKKGHVHNDIKLDNITYNPETHILKFIDFFDTFESKHEYLTKTHFTSYIRAPELWKITRRPPLRTPAQVKLLIKIFKDARFFNDEDGNVFEELMAGKGAYRAATNNWWLLELLDFVEKGGSKDFSKTDVYSLGLVALQVFYRGFPRLRKVINGMLRPDPSIRLTVDHAHEAWRSIISADDLSLNRAAMTISFMLMI